MRPVESMSMVPVSLPGRGTPVADGRWLHRSYVPVASSYSRDTSELDGPCSSTCVTSPTLLVSARTPVSLDRCSTLVQPPGSSFHSQAPTGTTSVDATTAHQAPSCRQTLDCGFSPV